MAKRKVEIEHRIRMELTVTVRGLTPLLQNRYEEKPKGKEETPEEAAKRQTHFMPDGTVGFPGIAFKRAIVATGRTESAWDMTKLKQAIQILTPGLVPLKFKKKDIFTTMVIRPPGKGTPAIGHGPRFYDWICQFTIAFHPTQQLTTGEVIRLINVAGMEVGVGRGRPGSPRGGIGFGLFEVADAYEKQF